MFPFYSGSLPTPCCCATQRLLVTRNKPICVSRTIHSHTSKHIQPYAFVLQRTLTPTPATSSNNMLLCYPTTPGHTQQTHLCVQDHSLPHQQAHPTTCFVTPHQHPQTLSMRGQHPQTAMNVSMLGQHPLLRPPACLVTARPPPWLPILRQHPPPLAVSVLEHQAVSMLGQHKPTAMAVSMPGLPPGLPPATTITFLCLSNPPVVPGIPRNAFPYGVGVGRGEQQQHENSASQPRFHAQGWNKSFRETPSL